MAPALALPSLSFWDEELTPTKSSLSCPTAHLLQQAAPRRSVWPGLPIPQGLEPAAEQHLPSPGQDSGAQKHPPNPTSQITLASGQTAPKRQVILVIPGTWLWLRMMPSFWTIGLVWGDRGSWPRPRGEPHVLHRGFPAALSSPAPQHPTGVSSPAQSTQRPPGLGGGPAAPPPSACLGAGCWPGRRRAGCRPRCPIHAAPWKPACLPCVLGAGLKPVPFGSEAGPPQAWGSCVHSGEAGRTAWVLRGPGHQCFPGKGVRASGAEAAPRACSYVPQWAGPRSTVCLPAGAAPTLRSLVPPLVLSGQGEVPAPTSQQPVGTLVPRHHSPGPGVREPALWSCFLAFMVPRPPHVALPPHLVSLAFHRPLGVNMLPQLALTCCDGEGRPHPSGWAG